MKVYFDNAATTPIDKEVFDAMVPYMQEHFGNPSSIHSFGRKTRAGIENARKIIAKHLNVSPSEIVFTSGGTEAINTAIRCAVNDLEVKHIVTSKIEHHAVLHSVEALERTGKIKLSFVNLDKNGHVVLEHLEELLKAHHTKGRNNAGTPALPPLGPTKVRTLAKPRGGGALVSLMHANNEIGNLLPLKRTGELCEKYNAVFHCDTTQTMAHYKLDFSRQGGMHVDMANGAAHKFHGPKGVGFLYLNSRMPACHKADLLNAGGKIKPLIYGGSQERNMRGGTENLYGIIGIGKAFEIAHRDMEGHRAHIQGLKNYMIEQLEKNIPGVEFNGDAKGSSLYTVLNVLFPPSENAEMLLFNLDIAGIAVSGGSACASGSNIGSHVLTHIGTDMSRPAVRFSFSKYNTKEEVDYCIATLKELFSPSLKMIKK